MSPRWADHSEYMPIVGEYIIRCAQEGRRPLVREIRELTGVGARLGATLLRNAGIEPARGRPWPAHGEYMPDLQDLLLKLQRRGHEGIAAALVQRKLGVSATVAAALLDELGLASERIPDAELLPLIARFGSSGPVTLKALKDEFRLRPDRARRLAEAAGIELAAPAKLARGTANINAKLTHDEVVAIARALDAGQKPEHIRQSYPHVTRETISHIKHGRTWSHVTGRRPPERAAR